MQLSIKKSLPYIAWVQALIATSMSLYFSEVVHLPPCVLCWYQRIFMYPLVIILAVGILRKDTKMYLYALPLSILGMLVALYQNLLYYNILPEGVAPCTAGISCTSRLIEWFGFITIPLLSLSAFTIISLCILLYKKYNNNQ